MFIDIGTLAGNTLVRATVTDNVEDTTWLSSVRLNWSWDNVTDTSGGPLMVGISHSAYSAAELEQWIENAGSWQRGSLVNQEIAKRKIRQVGVLLPPATADEHAELNDGKPINTKCGWMLDEDQSLTIWAYNLGSASFATTTPNLSVQGHANLWPQ